MSLRDRITKKLEQVEIDKSKIKLNTKQIENIQKQLQHKIQSKPNILKQKKIKLKQSNDFYNKNLSWQN